MKKEKELIELAHEYKMIEIEAEKKARIEVERLKFDLSLQLHRLKRADIERQIKARGH